MKGKKAAGVPSGVAQACLIGVAAGLVISLAVFYHSSRLNRLQAELQGELRYHESTAIEERQRRELAEQMQVEADTERTKVQGQLKELSGSVVLAQAAEKAAKTAAQAAEERVTTAEKEAAATAQKLQLLQAEMDKLANQKQAGAAVAAAAAADSAADRHAPWQPSAERDAEDPELAALLRKVAKDSQVLVAISNRNYAGKGSMLDTWMRNVQRAGVSNALVVALDEDTHAFCKDRGFPAIVMTLQISDSQKGVGSNHAVSGLKFKVLQRFLRLGYGVLLSDVDILVFQDPFPHIFGDSDVEAMSDGWDNATAYGYNDVADDPAMGWARYAHSMRVFCFNSGLFYIRPTPAALLLLQRVMHRIETEAGWDQAIFNEVIFFPSHNEYQDPAVTRRVMDFYRFMNSKVLFKQVRNDPALRARPPVTLHVNYHSNKAERMAAAEAFWVRGEEGPLMALPVGS